jgi:flavodoxin
MIDSLAASELFSRFDDEHLAKNGFRLPSDPYCLAPPQGSLIPLWHRGTSPNYQPKPMVCHHVQDPIKAWQREQECVHGSSQPSKRSRLSVDDGHSGPTKRSRLSLEQEAPLSLVRSASRIFIGFCSSGTVGLKLSKKLHSLLLETTSLNPSVGRVMPIQPLNKLRKIQFSPEYRLIIVASNTKRGEMPQNGIEFLKALEANSLAVTPTSFAIFGNGSRDYPDTFTQTASVLEKLMEQRGAVRFVRTVQADTASENPPWSAFEDFHKLLTQSLLGMPPSPPLSDGGGVEFQTKDEDNEAFSHLKQWFRAEATMKTTGGVGMDHKM